MGEDENIDMWIALFTYPRCMPAYLSNWLIGIGLNWTIIH